LVVRPDHTKRNLCFRALDTVPKDKLLGVVINMAPDWFLSRRVAHAYPEQGRADKPRQADDFL
jgi:Mrp family chromosome partitioning ATPase